jgi:HD-GYP domain-containing protein (c-di-GMP phosphodiesterase class II)
MEKRVSADELTLGMFVAELDRPWIDTPFLLQGFLIQDEETLAQLRATCRHVVIDLYRSDFKAVGEISQPAARAPAAPAQPRVVHVTTPAANVRRVEEKRDGWLSRILGARKQQTEPALKPAYAGAQDNPKQPRAAPRAVAAAPAAVRVQRVQAPAAPPPSAPTPPAPRTPAGSGGLVHSTRDLLSRLRDALLSASPGAGLFAPADLPDADGRSTEAHGADTGTPVVRVYEDPAALARELAPAARSFARATDVMETVIRDLRAGKGLELEAIETVVGDLVDSMLRNPDALQLVSSLRESDASAYTHALQVAVLLVAFGRELGFSKDELQHLGQVGMLLDIGKLRVRRELLDKRSNLTAVEFAAVKQHVEHGLEMIRTSRSVHPDVLTGVAQHHERINGAGYPRGLRGAEISAYGQMAGIVDTFAALTSPRPYADPIPPYNAMRSLQSWSESSFRGALVEQFIQAIGIFPVGSLVELSTGETAIVVGQHKSHRLKPRVLIITGPDKSPLKVPASLDLLYAQDGPSGSPPYIVRGLPVDASGVDPAEYYLSR